MPPTVIAFDSSMQHVRKWTQQDSRYLPMWQRASMVVLGGRCKQIRNKIIGKLIKWNIVVAKNVKYAKQTLLQHVVAFIVLNFLFCCTCIIAFSLLLQIKAKLQLKFSQIVASQRGITPAGDS